MDGEAIGAARWRRDAAPLAIALAAGAAVNLCGWYPGKGNPDSADQYAQILAHDFNDWHPPAMARLWQGLMLFGEGTGPLFVTNILLYWLAAATIALTLERTGRRVTAWATLGLFAMPAFVMLNINITKDAHLAAVLLAAFGLLFRHRGAGQPVPTGTALIATALIGYAALVRSNAVFAVPPMLAFAWRPGWTARPVRLALGSCLVALALVPVSGAVNRQVLGAKDAAAIRSLQLFDLAGIAARAGDPRVLGPESRVDAAMVRRCYTPIMWDTLADPATCPRLVAALGRAVPAGQGLPPLGDLWIAAIRAHPAAYALHRIAHFNSATFFWEPTHHLDAVRPVATAGARAPTLANRTLDALRYLVPLMPVVLLAAGVAMGAGLLIDARLRAAAAETGMTALLVSALAYGFSFLIVGVATDLRYFQYPGMAVLAGAIVGLPVPGDVFRARGTGKIAVGLACAVALVAIVTQVARIMLPPPAPAGTARSLPPPTPGHAA